MQRGLSGYGITLGRGASFIGCAPWGVGGNMPNITGVWVSHEVAPLWRVRIEVLTATPTESNVCLDHNGTSWRIERDAHGGVVMAGRPGWPASVPVGVRKTVTLILESHDHGVTSDPPTCNKCQHVCDGQYECTKCGGDVMEPCDTLCVDCDAAASDGNG